MKKVIALIAITLALFLPAESVFADIQAPPSARYGKARKLGRGINNLLFFWGEIPAEWQRTLDTDGNTAAASYGLVNGFKKSGVRFAYGLFEIITFGHPTYKRGYREPYYHNERMNPFDGYSEFVPQLGIIADKKYGRVQTY